ncbi:MAG TPA: DUF2164 domain-containing protein [Mobilitalea sp.]|nr:DUF2164 domain-containing protein [Mobilitalea sp.]
MDRKTNALNINLTNEEKKQLLEEIQYYFETERGENLGILATESIFDFFLDTLGKHIYNKALDDTKKWYTNRMEDVEADFYALYKPLP